MKLVMYLNNKVFILSRRYISMPEEQEKAQEDKIQEELETANEAKQEMNKILKELRQKMNEIDSLTREIDEKRKEINPSSPKKTKKLLEEIKVPPLEMLK